MLSTPTKADVKPPTQADLVRLTGVQVLARLPVEIMRAERRAGRNTAGWRKRADSGILSIHLSGNYTYYRVASCYLPHL